MSDIDRIVNWEDPGPGGFYDNLGVEGKQPHLVRQKTWWDDPGYIHSPIEYNAHKLDSTDRQSWMASIITRYETPLLVRYEGLDPSATYKIKVMYKGPFDPRMKLEAEGYLIHGPRGNTGSSPVAYSIPQAATRDGDLELKWQLTNTVRGPSVSELWLVVANPKLTGE